MPGRYTREGDVRALLSQSDDMFVIAAPGDEIALAFDAAAAALPAGWTMTFLLEADGYSKEMDINSASPDGVAPLPFHRMSGYPYHGSEHYPATPGHERYQAEYNTRFVGRSVPPLAGGTQSSPSPQRFMSFLCDLSGLCVPPGQTAGRRDGVHDREAR
jgi:hypothetical protein